MGESGRKAEVSHAEDCVSENGQARADLKIGISFRPGLVGRSCPGLHGDLDFPFLLFDNFRSLTIH